MIELDIPGKVVLAGEYSVLLPGTPCLVAAVDRGLKLVATPSLRWTARAGDFRWTDGEPVPEGLRFLVAGIEAVRLRVPTRAMDVVATDTMHADGHKLGLGGSAAAAVGGVWLAARGTSLTAEDRWELADAPVRTWRRRPTEACCATGAIHVGPGPWTYTRRCGSWSRGPARARRPPRASSAGMPS